MSGLDWGAMHSAGVQLALTFALYFAGFSVGRYFVYVVRNEIRGSVALADIIRDTAVAFGVGYVSGGLVNAIARTNLGYTLAGVINSINASKYELGNFFATLTPGVSFGATLTIIIPALIVGAFVGGVFALIFGKQ